MARILFYPLDVGQEVRGGKGEVWLWGITSDQKRVLLVDDSFYDYFYVLSDDIERAEKVLATLAGVASVEVVERRYMGNPVKAVKVCVKNPEELDKIANKAKSLLKNNCKLFEHDVRYSMKYLIDSGLKPCRWYEVEVEPVGRGFELQVSNVYYLKKIVREIEDVPPPKLRILYFSAVYYASRGSPKPEVDPVLVVSCLNGENEFVQFVAEERVENGRRIVEDRKLIEQFRDYVVKYDPDVVVGFGSNSRDWNYLVKRAKLNGIRLTISRARSEPHTSLYGHVSIAGRVNMDLLDYADEFGAVKVKTLENIADYLGVKKLDERVVVEEYEVAEKWDNPETRQEVLESSKADVESVKGIADLIVDFGFELASLIGIPPDVAGAAAVGFRVEWFLIRNAHKIGELVPEREERQYYTYAGAVVLQPKPGIHENVAVLDFKSMYPSIMIHYNISPDTLVKNGAADVEVIRAPEVGHAFRQDRPGFYKEVLQELLRARDEIKRKLKQLSPTEPLYRVLDARQKAIKVIANACYGYAGWIGARWYVREVAEAITAFGRSTITRTVEKAKSLGLDVLYGDTDSLMVFHNEEKVEKLLEWVEKELKLEIKLEKIYKRILFTEAKKRYAGLLPDGRIEIVGLEVVRGDWAAIAKKAQERVIEILLREGNKQKALDFVRELAKSLREGKVPMRDLIIWKTLTKKVTEYEARAPHVSAAKILMEHGWDVDVGDKVGYVVVKGPGKIYERARPYFMVKMEDIDVEYYIEHQVVPAVTRILEVVGYKERHVLDAVSSATQRTTTLFDFVKK